jgi:ribosomal protein S18 acetylase RimI-like enzyme
MVRAASTASRSLELARRIQASIRADASRARDVERIGPFVATFNRDDSNVFLNYAIPDEGAHPAPTDVDTLVASYRRQNRKPRLEYLPVLAPTVEPALTDGGFVVEGRLPLMMCASSADLIESEVPGIELLSPSGEADFQAVATVQWRAYEERGAVPQRVVDGLRRSAEAGGVVILARDAEGEAAGAGQCTPPSDGLTELTSVGVPEGFRRRGIAQALTARLARDAFANGATSVFLMARGEAEARIYGRSGFRHEGEVLHISLP